MNATGCVHAGADLDDGWLVERVAGEAATYLDEDEVARAHLEGAGPASMSESGVEHLATLATPPIFKAPAVWGAISTRLEGVEPPGLLDDEIVWLAEVEATVEIAGVEKDMGPCLDESESGAGHLDMLATPPVLSDTHLKDPSWSTVGVLDRCGPRSTRTTAKDLAPTPGGMSPA
ncbi:hypothetical protein BC826DRAFT_1102501 [Russula brevipes]|nr:hypothetical protein BC826DRAFT_1102501 [Russula brevipes]